MVRVLPARHSRDHRLTDKRGALAEASGRLDSLRITLRLAKRLGFLPGSAYASLTETADEVGRMLGGWLKHERTREEGGGGEPQAAAKPSRGATAAPHRRKGAVRYTMQSPIVERYLAAKLAHPTALVLVELGAFCQAFFEDAQLLGRELGLRAWPDSADPHSADLKAPPASAFTSSTAASDAAGQPRRAYVPLLRVGAMIHYAASLTHRFQEQEEAWVDARTGLALPVGAHDALRRHPQLPEADARHAALEAELSLAVSHAHAALEDRAATRAAALLAQGRRALQSELARADTYYSGTLESIERRRATAPADRVRLLDAQAEATRAEQARRQREIEEQHRPRHELRPFRLHLVLAPAFVLSVEIRRGRRAYPFELAWLGLRGLVRRGALPPLRRRRGASGGA